MATLEAIEQEPIALQQIRERKQYAALAREFEMRWQQLTLRHQERKQQRQQQRQVLLKTLAGVALTEAIKQMDEQSRREGIERRQFKRQREALLQPLKQVIADADARLHQLKQQRKSLSRQL